MKKQKLAGLITLAIGTGGVMYYRNNYFKYFTKDEFKDKISGANKINSKLIRMLDNAREIAGVPFVINSGYRDINHPESIKNPTSSHIKGVAVDISINNTTKIKIYEALKQAGFNRIGVASNFIHADIDTDKPQFRTWFYSGIPSIDNRYEGI